MESEIELVELPFAHRNFVLKLLRDMNLKAFCDLLFHQSFNVVCNLLLDYICKGKPDEMKLWDIQK